MQTGILDADYDWLQQLASQAYAYERPEIEGEIKVDPQDFKVTELMEIQPSGEGEHYWLDITKVRQNTDQVAKALARFAGVAYRDVGYSGLKDFHAVTRQWFSVWRPKGDALDWSDFKAQNVQVHCVRKHSRKIKRSTHAANQFDILVRELDSLPSLDIQKQLEYRLAKIKKRGVPNYFGEQRFGRRARNMNQAIDMLVNDKRIKDRKLRGYLLSSARAWLFNVILSERVLEGSWECLYANEPANLNGTNSVFISNEDDTQSDSLAHRLRELDIHPTAPLWGEQSDRLLAHSELYEKERQILTPFKPLCLGLENARLAYQRRALRIVVQNLQWELMANQLRLSFSLPAGQFATSVLREIIAPKIATTIAPSFF